jgi:hypothetical protein
MHSLRHYTVRLQRSQRLQYQLARRAAWFVPAAVLWMLAVVYALAR